MSKLETNSVGPWSKADVTVSGLRCGDAGSNRDGVIRYRDDQFQFRENGVWRTLSDPISIDANTPLKLVYAPAAPFSGPRNGNVFKTFEMLYEVASAFPGAKEIFFSNEHLDKFPENIVGASYDSWPNETNSCVIPPGDYDFRNTSLKSLYGRWNLEKAVVMLDMAGSSANNSLGAHVPVLIKNGVRIKNLSEISGLFLIGDFEGYDDPPITYSGLSDISGRHDISAPDGSVTSFTYFALSLKDCWVIGGGGTPMLSGLIPGRTRSLVLIDVRDFETDKNAMLVSTERSIILGNNVFSLVGGVTLSLQDSFGTSSCFDHSFTTELDTVDPALNEVVPFQTLTGDFKFDHSDWSGMPITPTQSVLQKIIYTPDTSMFSSSDPEHLEDALNRMGWAIVQIRMFIENMVTAGAVPPGLPGGWGTDEEIP